MYLAEPFQGRASISLAEPLPKPTCRRTTRTKITIKYWVSQLQCCFGEAVCTSLFRTDFFARISARIFCTDFLHRAFCTELFARIFCTDFCTDSLRGFLPDFVAWISARIICKKACTDVCADFCMDFLGFPKTLAGKRQNFTEKIPWKIHHALGAFWGGAREAGG